MNIKLHLVACDLSSIALPAETKLIDYLHFVLALKRLEVGEQRRFRESDNILLAVSVLSDNPPLVIGCCLLSWWVKQMIHCLFTNINTHLRALLKLYPRLPAQSVPGRMACPPWPKGKKMVHLDLKGAPPRAEYLHKVRALSINCNNLLQDILTALSLFK